MRTEQDLVFHLNAVLRHTLTGINQYFLHARLLKHMGCMKLADKEYKQSLDSMKQADMLVERVLLAGGLPNLQELGTLLIGDDIESILRGDMYMLEEAMEDTQAALKALAQMQDEASITLLRHITQNQLAHKEYLEAQLNAVQTTPRDVYLKSVA